MSLQKKNKCKHRNVKRGADIELQYGSHQTRICLDCKRWRSVGHTGTVITNWKKTGYYAATSAYEEEL